jgi:serine/threonine-protein kinase
VYCRLERVWDNSVAITLEQFVQHLTASGLMSATDISAFQESLPSGKRPKDAETLARGLVQANKLTKYQAQLVYQGKVKGLVFGEYVVLDKLGQGGMGVVLKAQHRRMDRIVAVKMISGAALKSPDAARRFYREVKAAAKLEHTNIVTAYDASEHEGGHYLVMQFVDGKDLAAIVKEQGPLPVSQAMDFIIQAARGLQYAHEQGIVHRDIKPSNLLVDRRGTVKILDMGLARIAGLADEEDKDRLTASGQVMGTCDYMAPEQAMDTHHADARADIYSLGCTLYRILAGETIYQGETLAKILISHQMSPIPSLCSVRSDIPPQLDAIFQKMVAKKAEDRQQSMTEVIADLETCMGRRSATSTSVGAEATADFGAANLAFLRQQAPPHGTATVGKKKVEQLAEATIAHQAAASETSKQLSKDEELQGAPRKKKTLIVAVAAGLLGVVGIISVYLAITIRVRHPDGSETVMRVPDGSVVTVTRDNDGKSAAKQVGYGHGAPPLAKPSMSSTEAAQLQKQWADYLRVPVEQTNSIGMRFVLIPPGEFGMGPTEEDIAWALGWGQKNNFIGKRYLEEEARQVPRHHVKISKPFYLGMYTVTQAEYKKVIGTNPSAFTEKQVDVSTFKPPLDRKETEEREKDAKKVMGKDTSRYPVETVNWEEVMEFCRTLSAMPAEQTARRVYRLPTEAEWEHACRAGTTTHWYCGDDEAGVIEAAWFNGNSGKMTHPVGGKKPNAFGLYDMIGNVNQWCSDWFGQDYYKQSPQSDPAGPLTGSFRVARGGSWNLYGYTCRSTHRMVYEPVRRFPDFGFRVVCEIATNEQAAWQDAINLLPLIDPKKDLAEGTWARGAQGLEATDIKCMSQKIQPPYRPAEEYDYRVSFTPIAGNADVAVGLTAKGRSFVFYMKRYASDHCSGFESINGRIIANGPTARRFPHLELGRRYTVLVEVRKQGLKAWLDGELVAQWATDYHDMSPFRVWKFKDDALLGVGCSLSKVVFHEIEVREVTGKGQFTRGAAKASAVDDAFIKEVAALPAEQRIARVVAKLKELNPGYDGKEEHRIANGRVASLTLKNTTIKDIAPVRALVNLTTLECNGPSGTNRSPLSDLTPLQGLPLSFLQCGYSKVADLSPLHDMSLTFLKCQFTEVADLKPLQGMPLEDLDANNTAVSDLSPLRGLPLKSLSSKGTRVTDLSPLKDTPLKTLWCDFVPQRDSELLRSIKTLEKINGLPVAEFWKRVEAGKIPQP